MDNWDLVGGDPAPGDDVEARSLSSLFDEVAYIAKSAKVSLVGIRDQSGDAIWKGEAAREFQERIEELPEHLTKLHDSYVKAGDALDTFGSDLAALQGRASTQLNNAEYADAEVTRLQRQEEAAAAFIGPTEAPAPGSAGCVTDLQEARNLLASARIEVQTIRDDMTLAEDRCIEGLTAGQDLGMRNQSFLAEIFEIVGNVCDILVFVLTVIAVLVVIFSPLGFLAALALIGPLMALCTALSVIKLGTMVARRALGDEVSLSDIAEEAVLLLLPSGLARAGRGALNLLFPSTGAIVDGAQRGVRAFYGSGAGDATVRGLTNGGSRLTHGATSRVNQVADTVAARSGSIPVLSDMRRLSLSFGAAGPQSSIAARLQRGYYIDVMAEGRTFDITGAASGFALQIDGADGPFDAPSGVADAAVNWAVEGLVQVFEPSPSLPPLDPCTPIPSMGPSDGASTHNVPIPAGQR